MRLENFAQFESQTSILENLLTLNPEKCMPKFGLNEFKNIFKRSLMLESIGTENESMLQKAHAYYEIHMLNESKGNWFESEGNAPVYIDAEEHMILVKNNEAFIISKSTFQAINEGWGWEDVKGAWDNYTKEVVKVGTSAIKGVSAKVDQLSDGTKKAWEWVKAAGSAAVKFLSKMSFIDWATLGLGVLSACIGIVGSGIPGATIIAGVILALTGGIHIYEGIHKYNEAVEILKEVRGDNLSKFTAPINNALPDIAMGSVFTILGIHDITSGITDALVNPLAGSVSLGIKAPAIVAANKSVKSMAHVIEETMGGGWAAEVMKNLSKNKVLQKVVKKSAEYTAFQLAGTLGHGILVSALGWMYKGCLKIGKDIDEGISWVLDLPGKITSGIESLQKDPKGLIGTIIAKGLNTLVKPLTQSASNMLEKYIKPSLNSAKEWFDRQIIIYDECSKVLSKKKGTHEGLIFEEEDAIPGVETTEIPKEKVQLIDKKGGEKHKKEDEKILDEIPDEKIDNEIENNTGPGYDYKKLAKESRSFPLKHLKLFENFKK